MEYCFHDEHNYRLFQNIFFAYLVKTHDPFFGLLETRLGSKVNADPASSGKTHLDRFLSELSTHSLTALARKERRMSISVVSEMQFTVIRYDLETGYRQYSLEIQKNVHEYQSVFPCFFSRVEKPTVALQQEYDDLLDKILDFFDALPSFDPERISRFIQSHYEDINSSWVKERIQFLNTYFRGNDALLRAREMVSLARKEAICSTSRETRTA